VDARILLVEDDPSIRTGVHTGRAAWSGVGYDYLGDSRLVDVAIGRLRARVEVDPTAPELILTVRGSGYKAVRAAG
jgi:DNA-binding response OmpR family regulator